MNQIIPARPWSTAASIEKLNSIVTRVVMALEAWRHWHMSSMQLARVDARILRDAGISEAQRFIAVNRPFRDS